MIRFVYRHDITIDLAGWRELVGAAKGVSPCQTLHDERTSSHTMSMCGGESCATRAGWSLGALVNSEELLLDLPRAPPMWYEFPGNVVLAARLTGLY